MYRTLTLIFIACLVLPVPFAAQALQDVTATPTEGSRCSVTPPQSDATSPLAGKLGGTEKEFEAIYGKPVREDMFPVYMLEGCAVLQASFSEDGILTLLIINSYRQDGPDRANYDKSDPADWTQDQADAFAFAFLPNDVKFIDVFVDLDNMIFHIGSSETFKSAIPTSVYDEADSTPVYGGFSYSYSLTEDKFVPYLFLNLSYHQER